MIVVPALGRTNSLSITETLGRNHMQKLGVPVLALILLVVSGCAWQRIPALPEHDAVASLPIRVGVILGDTGASALYGPAIVSAWKEMKLFESLTYPYRSGDPVDAVLSLTVTGGWTGSGFGAGFLVGVTLGLAGPAVGPSMTGKHEASAVLSKDEGAVIKYVANVETSVAWGVLADASEVGAKADVLHQRKLAVELARKLEADRAQITKVFGE
ncbi:hypothetical protein BH18PSE1_BH18PSE1_08100 [soil metagenome]